MRTVKGKQVYDSLEELLDPRHTAVLVVDMQRDGYDPQGYFARIGANVELVRAIVPKLADFLGEARRAGVQVVYVNQVCLREGRSDSPAWLHLKLRAYKLIPPALGPEDDYMVEGTEGQQVIDDLRPQQGDLLVEKTRASGFVNTHLDRLLRANGIETVVITGESSYGCVLNTVMDASCYDYYTIVAEDLVIGPNEQFHEAALMLMRPRYLCTASEEIMRVWNRQR